MSKHSYNVVFENTLEYWGSAFMRTIISYPDKETFEANYRPTPSEKILAQSLPEDEATNLCHLAPIITYYTHAVEEIFEHGEPKDWSIAPYFLSMADYGSIDTHKERRRLGLRYSVPTGLVEHLEKLSTGQTKKARFIKAIVDAYVVSKDELYGPLVKQNLRKIEPKLFLVD